MFPVTVYDLLGGTGGGRSCNKVPYTSHLVSRPKLHGLKTLVPVNGVRLAYAYQIQSEQRARLLDHLLVCTFLRRIGRWRASDWLRPRSRSGSGTCGRGDVPLNGPRIGGRWLLRLLLPDTGCNTYGGFSQRPSSSHSPTSPRRLKYRVSKLGIFKNRISRVFFLFFFCFLFFFIEDTC